MHDSKERALRIATLGIVGLAALICTVYLFILLIPRSSSPFSPSISAPGTVAPAPGPSETSRLYAYYPVLQKCVASQGIFIRGTVWSGTQPLDGVSLRISDRPNGDALDDQNTHRQMDGSLGYTFVLKPNGSFGPTPADWYVWVVDENGAPASDPNAGHVVTNNLPPEDPKACWLAVLDFASH